MALDPITAGIDLVSSVVSRIWPNADDQVKAKAALAELAATGELKRSEEHTLNSSHIPLSRMPSSA